TITKVEFYNGVSGSPVCTATTSPYSCTWSAPTSGFYYVTAVAYDSLGLTATSTPVGSVQVDALPNVTLTSPSAGAIFPRGASIPFAATATDSDGTISRVDFSASGIMCTATTAPYQCNGTISTSGQYSVVATAYDNLVRGKNSAVISILVDNVPTVS